MMSEEIGRIPIRDVLAPDGHVWMWCTNAHLAKAIDILRGWRLEYKTCRTWCKQRIGLGWWLRGQTEHMLWSVASDKLRKNPGRWSTVFHAPIRSHSEKPDEFRDCIEALSPAPYLELFARESHTNRGRARWTYVCADKESDGYGYTE